MSDTPTELYLKYRPKSLKDVFGQPRAVKALSEMLEQKKVPHCILFSGPSGCGKTTLARILKNKLKCADHDFSEVNCADLRGIDMVRDIRTVMTLSPIGGNCRVWIVDEAHKITGDAQNAMLKMLEDTPSHVYFFLCTTDPNKIIKTVRSRCTEVKLENLGNQDSRRLLEDVLKKEKTKVEDDVLEKIIECADGSARKSLVLLGQALLHESSEDQIDAIQKSNVDRQGIDIARALFNPKNKWPDVASILNSIEVDAEDVRRIVLGYASSIAVGNAKGSKPASGPSLSRAIAVINAFEMNFYESGKAGLIRACYDVIAGG